MLTQRNLNSNHRRQVHAASKRVGEECVVSNLVLKVDEAEVEHVKHSAQLGVADALPELEETLSVYVPEHPGAGYEETPGALVVEGVLAHLALGE